MIQFQFYRVCWLVVVASLLVSATGCATFFRGYEDRLIIRNLSDSTQVFTSEGVKLQVFKDKQPSDIKQKEKLITGKEVEMVVGKSEEIYSYVLLPTRREYILVIKKGEKETRYEVYPTLSIGWFLLDCLFPLALIIDLYTGNINGYTELKIEK